MKYLKVLLVAVVTVITFGSAQAQVVVRARVGAPVHRRHFVRHRTVVVVRRPIIRHRYVRHHRYHRHY